MLRVGFLLGFPSAEHAFPLPPKLNKLVESGRATSRDFVEPFYERFLMIVSSHLWRLVVYCRARAFLLSIPGLVGYGLGKSPSARSAKSKTSYVLPSYWFLCFFLFVVGIRSGVGRRGVDRIQSSSPPHSFGELFSMPRAGRGEAQGGIAFGHGGRVARRSWRRTGGRRS